MDPKVIKLLDEIKKLLILSLIEKGVRGKRIAKVLGIDAAAVSRIVSPKGAGK
jgi:predicted transcriptional regulator